MPITVGLVFFAAQGIAPIRRCHFDADDITFFIARKLNF